MTSVTLRFVGQASLGSRVIGWFSAGHLSHVDAVLPDGTLFGAYEARAGGYPTGCVARSPDYISPLRAALVEVPCTGEQLARFLAYLMAQSGKGYDWWVIAGFLLGREWRSRGRWICSELQAAALSAAGILPETVLLGANKITPMALAFALSCLPGTKVTKTGAWPPVVTVGEDPRRALILR